MSQDSRFEASIAILPQGDRFLMQLRDNIPEIFYAGLWGLFGGQIEPGETPEDAIVRELEEEIGYVPPSYEKFAIYADEKIIRHVFHVPLVVELSTLTLMEGWDLGLVTQAELEQGKKFSAIANQTRPLGPVHQQILLDFIQSRQNIVST
jgi:8-oxo-dGTP pyrophosphatase MutT (NUDIX family)